ncbi:hypothetical protein Daus18300_002558 [Diaporthe australafricana]|uniref:Rhodopsin domain-containing protein n=1 Tax=Diaporthe australafricana TaxID=127596 RepID=A0ABR3XLT3_9PEZI
MSDQTDEPSTKPLVAARTNDEICHVPKRSRKGDLIAEIPICVVAFFANIFRLYARWRLHTKFDTDDWIMLAVAVLFIPFQIVAQYFAFYSFGVDAWYVSPRDLTYSLKLFYVSELFYVTVLSLTKISILFFFLRIFPNERFRLCCWIVMGWIAVSSAVFLFVGMFQCMPVDAIWRSWDGAYPGNYHCVNVNSLVYAAAGCSIAQDLTILVMPLPLILRLNTNWRRKAGTVIMFSLGIFVLITSCVRLRFLVQFARSRNPTWDYVDTHLWSDLEASVSIIAASLPAIRLYLATVWPKAFLSKARKSSAQSSGAQSYDVKRWTPQGMLSRSGRTSHAGEQAAGGKPGYLSRLLGKTTQRNKRGVNESELELADTARSSVQSEMSVRHVDVDASDSSQHRPALEIVGKYIPLDVEIGDPFHDSVIPTSSTIRVSAIKRRTKEDDQS